MTDLRAHFSSLFCGPIFDFGVVTCQQLVTNIYLTDRFSQIWILLQAYVYLQQFMSLFKLFFSLISYFGVSAASN